MKLEDIEKEQEIITKELEGLINDAGISAEVQKAQEGPWPLFLGDIAPFGSEERAAQIKIEEGYEHNYYKRKIRNAYFSVQDIELRKKLIEKERKKQKLHGQYFEAQVYLARQELKKTKGTRSTSCYYIAALISAVTVFLGHAFFSISGAVAGAIVGYFLGRKIEESARRDYELLVIDAEDNLQEAEKAWQDVKNQPEIFLLGEENGEQSL
jgi:hypothetical protein